MKEQELTLILVDLLTRLAVAQERQASAFDALADYVESIADAIASHAEVFTAANDEGVRE